MRWLCTASSYAPDRGKRRLSFTKPRNGMTASGHGSKVIPTRWRYIVIGRDSKSTAGHLEKSVCLPATTDASWRSPRHLSPQTSHASRLAVRPSQAAISTRRRRGFKSAERSAFSAVDLLALNEPEARSKLSEAEALLRAELEDGPRPVSELRAAALEFGISITTLDRAKKQVGARSVKLDLDRWGWELSDTGPSEDEAAAA